MKICPDCHKVVPAIDAVEIDGKSYHKRCRMCAQCGGLIYNGKEVDNGKSYHASCLHQTKVCAVCGKPTYRYIPGYWGDVACSEHSDTCRYCGQFLSPRTRGGNSFSYTYVRNGERICREEKICGLCQETIVKAPETIECCRREVMVVFNKNGITGIPTDIPIHLSDMVEEENKRGHGLWGLNHSHISPSRERYSCEITIHENLPYLLFKGVLAHELLHSWLHLFAIELPDNEKEGFCNLGKYLILRNEQANEAEYLIHWTLEQNSDPVYGEGYRLMKKRLDKLGWAGLMDALKWENKTMEKITI